jgi:hypothetical protein
MCKRRQVDWGAVGQGDTTRAGRVSPDLVCANAVTTPAETEKKLESRRRGRRGGVASVGEEEEKKERDCVIVVGS